jgi:hypothetical protein
MTDVDERKFGSLNRVAQVRGLDQPQEPSARVSVRRRGPIGAPERQGHWRD